MGRHWQNRPFRRIGNELLYERAYLHEMICNVIAERVEQMRFAEVIDGQFYGSNDSSWNTNRIFIFLCIATFSRSHIKKIEIYLFELLVQAPVNDSK